MLCMVVYETPSCVAAVRVLVVGSLLYSSRTSLISSLLVCGLPLPCLFATLPVYRNFLCHRRILGADGGVLPVVVCHHLRVLVILPQRMKCSTICASSSRENIWKGPSLSDRWYETAYSHCALFTPIYSQSND